MQLTSSWAFRRFLRIPFPPADPDKTAYRTSNVSTCRSPFRGYRRQTMSFALKRTRPLASKATYYIRRHIGHGHKQPLQAHLIEHHLLAEEEAIWPSSSVVCSPPGRNRTGIGAQALIASTLKKKMNASRPSDYCMMPSPQCRRARGPDDGEALVGIGNIQQEEQQRETGHESEYLVAAGSLRPFLIQTKIYVCLMCVS